jgi:hypothetical protein
VKEHLESIQKTKGQVMLAAAGLDTSFVTRILNVSDGFLTLQNTVPLKYISGFIEAQSHFLTTGSFRLSASQISSDGVNLVFSYNDIEQTSESRAEERIPIVKEEAWCEFVNPIDGRSKIRKRILDISKTGLSLVTTWNSDLLKPGRELPEITLDMAGVQQRVSGKIVYNRKFVSINGRIRHQIGIQLISEDANGQ